MWHLCLHHACAWYSPARHLFSAAVSDRGCAWVCPGVSVHIACVLLLECRCLWILCRAGFPWRTWTRPLCSLPSSIGTGSLLPAVCSKPCTWTISLRWLIMELSPLRPTPSGSRIITFLSGRCYAMVFYANVARLMVGLSSRRATSSAGSARSGRAYIWFFVARTRGFPWTAMTTMIQQTAQASVAMLRVTSMGLAWFPGAGGSRWLLSWASSHLNDFPVHQTSCWTWQWSLSRIHTMSKRTRMNRASCGFARRLFAASPVVMFARVFTHACFYAIVFASSLPQCIF